MGIKKGSARRRAEINIKPIERRPWHRQRPLRWVPTGPFPSERSEEDVHGRPDQPIHDAGAGRDRRRHRHRRHARDAAARTDTRPDARHSPPPPHRPAWRPPPADHGRTASLVFGVIILLVGLWFFASRTLGLDMPDIEWGQLWPLLLIGLGAWIVYRAMRRNR